MPNDTDDTLTEMGIRIAKDAIIHIKSGIDDFNHNPLPPTPRDDLANLALHGSEDTDHDRSFLSFLIKNIIEKTEASLIMTYVRLEKPARLFGKMQIRKSCPEAKDIKIKSLYEPQRRATVGETASLGQILQIIEMQDFVDHVRNCSAPVDRACREFKLAVERFSR